MLISSNTTLALSRRDSWLALQRQPSDDESPKTTKRHEIQSADHDSEPSGRWLCRRCRAPITQRSEEIPFTGRHRHIQVNPYGIEFEFGSFRSAPGATTTGLPTNEHTWFPGYRWSFAVCRRCSTHIGWFFTGEHPFHGLIFDRLIEDVPRSRT